jgi:hypothetical protein
MSKTQSLLMLQTPFFWDVMPRRIPEGWRHQAHTTLKVPGLIFFELQVVVSTVTTSV